MAKEAHYKSPRSKLIRFFQKSRDAWKAKHHELKNTCKYWENQARAVEKSRMAWRQRAETSEQRLAQLEAEIEGLKFGDG